MSVTKEDRIIPKLRFKEFVSNWETSSFENLLIHSKLGGNYSNDEKPNKNPLIKMGNLKRGNISLRKLNYVNDGETLDDDDLIKYGDLFFNTRNTLDLVGKVAIWRDELPRAFYNSNLMRLRFDNNFFMNYFFNSYNGIKSLKRLATGTTSVAAIYTRDLLKLKIVIPKISEQNKVAEFLGLVDKKIHLLDKKKEQLELYKKGIMQKIFSQEIRFKDDNGNRFPDWEEKKLGEISIISMGQSPNSKSYNQIGQGMLLVQGNADIKNRLTNPRQWTSEPTKKCQIGDLILTVRAPVGTIAKSVHNACIGRGVCSISNNSKSNIEFLYQALCNYEKNWVKLEQGSTFNAVSGKDIRGIILEIPSLAEQQKAADFLKSIDKKIKSVSVQIEKTKAFKKGLLQQMFV